MKPIYCCEHLKSQIEYKCIQHDKLNEQCPDVVISKGRSGYFLHSPNATYVCNYCPWCGKELKCT